MEYRFRVRAGQPALLIAGILAFAPVLGASGGVLERGIEGEVPLPAGSSLLVENLLGSIQVVGGGKPGAARIEGRIIADAASEDVAKATLESVLLQIDGTSAHVVYPLDRATAFYPPRESEAARRLVGGWIDALAALVSETRVTYDGQEVRIGKTRGSLGLAVHLVVTIPDGCSAVFDLGAGSIKITRARGTLRASLGAGRLLVEQAYGSLDLGTERADVTLRSFKGDDLRVETTSGNASLIDADAKTVRISTGSGGCEATSLTAGSITASTGEGDLFLGGLEAERYELSTVSGNLTMITNLERSKGGLLKSAS
jgi:hypothetical protein